MHASQGSFARMVDNISFRSQSVSHLSYLFSTIGVKQKCPGGYAGTLGHETRPLCSSICAAGFYCPPGSTTMYANSCGNTSFYCPEGSAFPLRAASGLLITSALVAPAPPGGATVSLCPVGFFCVNGGLLIPILCLPSHHAPR
jgi:hypothetical protein